VYPRYMSEPSKNMIPTPGNTIPFLSYRTTANFAIAIGADRVGRDKREQQLTSDNIRNLQLSRSEAFKPCTRNLLNW
jgi:hypothetical protein